MAEPALLILLSAGPLVAVGVGAWAGSGATAVPAWAGVALALFGGLVATLGIDWFVGSRERDALLEGTGEWLTLAGAIACLLLAAVALATVRR